MLMSSGDTNLFDLVLLSAFGRGNWIATELARKGWKVSLVDVTPQLGRVQWEDVEGPFGLLESEDLVESQRERLAAEGELTRIPGGFTMWLPEGPLEFSSELTSYLVRARSIATEAETYVRQAKPRGAEGERKALTKLMYARNWLAQFAHVFASRGHAENHSALNSGTIPSPLFSPFSIRRLTAKGHEKGLEIARAAGVTVRANAKIRDVRVGTSGLVEGAEIEYDGGGGFESGRAFVIGLSLDDTIVLGGGLGLYPKGVPKAVWSWERVRFTTSDVPIAIKSALPEWTVVIDDVDLAWTRANLMVLRRSAAGDHLDVWIKIPSWMRDETPAFVAVVNDVQQSLSRRLPMVKLQSTDLTRERAMWPVFETQDVEIATLKSKNTFYSAPGLWPEMDWLGRFRHETEIMARLEKMKALWDAAHRKQAERSARA
jgi:hypothetical protein